MRKEQIAAMLSGCGIGLGDLLEGLMPGGMGPEDFSVSVRKDKKVPAHIAVDAVCAGKDAEIKYLNEVIIELYQERTKSEEDHKKEVTSLKHDYSGLKKEYFRIKEVLESTRKELSNKISKARDQRDEHAAINTSVRAILETRASEIKGNARRDVLLGILKDLRKQSVPPSPAPQASNRE